MSRKEGDSLVIERGIKIVVMQCAGGGVRLGIEAPANVTILRGEIVHQIADENRRATAASGAVVAKECLPVAKVTAKG